MARSRVAEGYEAAIRGLALLSGVALLSILAGILCDILLRNLGLQPLAWMSALSEYAMLVVPCFAGPWLVRTNGHVVVDSLTRQLPPALERAAAVAAWLLCAVISLVLFWYSVAMTADQVQTGDLDIRAVAMPKWALTSVLVLAFGLMAIEFLLGLRRLLSGAPPQRSAGAL